jgi:hypothetical protein
MRTRRPGPNNVDVEVRLGRLARPRPNRLSDEATPNVLTGSAEGASRNAGPSWVGATPERGTRSAAGAPRTKPAQPARAGANWMTIAIVGFFLLSIARACLQGG